VIIFLYLFGYLSQTDFAESLITFVHVRTNTAGEGFTKIFQAKKGYGHWPDLASSFESRMWRGVVGVIRYSTGNDRDTVGLT